MSRVIVSGVVLVVDANSAWATKLPMPGICGVFLGSARADKDINRDQRRVGFLLADNPQAVRQRCLDRRGAVVGAQGRAIRGQAARQSE